jgi:hypothetical protein
MAEKKKSTKKEEAKAAANAEVEAKAAAVNEAEVEVSEELEERLEKAAQQVLEANKKMELKEEREQQEQPLSSLDLIWKSAFEELDGWAKRADYRDEVLLTAVNHYVDSVKRNRENLKAVTQQFNKELADWERSTREELLMSTTAIQHVLPIKSYEEINSVFNRIQKSTSDILKTPYRLVGSEQAADKYAAMVKQYVELRKKGRQEYVRSVKQTANLVYENQKIFVNLFSKQITSIFPFNKYLEKNEDLVKS